MRASAAASTASHPASVTTRDPPLCGWDGGVFSTESGQARSEKFFRARLDRANHLEIAALNQPAAVAFPCPGYLHRRWLIWIRPEGNLRWARQGESKSQLSGGRSGSLRSDAAVFALPARAGHVLVAHESSGPARARWVRGLEHDW
jgi:hypothetical protein